MLRRTLCLCLTLGAVQAGMAQSPRAVGDPEVAKGIRQAQDGDYDAAILTLDGAANRLGGSGGHAADLTEAYVYLGIAYLAKDHTTAAQARFRDALTHTPGLRLPADTFPPRVIELFERARQEAARNAPTPMPEPRPSPLAKTKAGRSRKGPVLVGAGLAAAAGIGIAAARGGSEDPGGQSQTFSGTVAPGGDDHYMVTARPGVLDARLSSTESRARPLLSITAGSIGGALVVQQVGNPVAQVSVTVAAQTYVLHVQNSGDPVAMPYTLTVTYP